MLNNKDKEQEKIEFILSKTPKLLLNQYVAISKLVLSYQVSSLDNDDTNHKLKFINDAYNAINIINKVVAMASNKLSVNNIRFLSDTEEYKEAILNNKINKLKSATKSRIDSINNYEEQAKRIEAIIEDNKEIFNNYEEPISNDLLDKVEFDTLAMKPIKDDEEN